MNFSRRYALQVYIKENVQKTFVNYAFLRYNQVCVMGEKCLYYRLY